MDRKNIISAIGACAIALASQGTFAALMYDQNVTSNAIFGSGNTNGSFTVDTQNNIELGLRGKLRHNASGNPENTFNSNGDGTYSFAAGVAPTQSSPTAVWSFEWSINSDQSGTGGLNLSALTYSLGIDSDAGIGTNYTSFDPIAVVWADHSIGDSGTGQGAGTVATDVATYAALILNNNLAQNSWKAHWFIPAFDPTVNGQYEFYLKAFDGEQLLAHTSMSIIVGTGAAAVPVPSTVALMGLVLAGLGWSRRKKI